MGLGQGAGRILGGRPGQHASGRIPQRPDPPQAQREVGGEPQQRGRLPATLLGLQRHRHHLLGLGGNVHFLRLGVASRVQADGVACQPGGIQEAQVEFCRLAGVHRIAPARSQHQPGQIAPGMKERHPEDAAQHEDQHVAQRQPVVDGQHQHDQQRTGKDQAHPGRQDVDPSTGEGEVAFPGGARAAEEAHSVGVGGRKRTLHRKGQGHGVERGRHVREWPPPSAARPPARRGRGGWWRRRAPA